MTPEQRAEKIVNYVEENLSHDANITTEYVTAQICEAENIAAAGSQTTMKEIAFRWEEEAYLKGRASMREEAAKVAEKYIEGRNKGSAAIIYDEIRGIAVTIK